MGAAHVPLAEIEDPFATLGWRVARPDDAGSPLHGQMLRELCNRSLVLHVGGAGERGVAATLQVVDDLQQQLVLVCDDDGAAVARALQARPPWAAARVHGVRVQFVLAAAWAAREHERRCRIQARWPREIYTASRRRVPRVKPGPPPPRAPVVRLCGGHALDSTRNLRVLDISALGCAWLLPAGMVPPVAGSRLAGIELELDDDRILLAEAEVLHVSAVGRGAHRVGCRWALLHGGGAGVLRRWLGESAAAARALGQESDFACGGVLR